MRLKDEKTVLWITLVSLTVLTYWPAFSSGRLPGGDMSDTVAQGYPFFSYTASRLSNWELPLWNPYIFCGIPFYESFSAPVFYPLRGLPMLIFGPEAAIRFLFPMHMLLAGFFSWLLLKELGVSRWGSLVGSVAYSAGAWANTLFYAGHGSKVICWAWFPLVLWAVLRFTRTRNSRYIGIGGLAIGMQGLSSHPQMILYTAGSALVLMLFQTVKPLGTSILKNAGGLLAILALGGAVAAVQIYPGYLFSKHTSRGNDLSLSAAASYSLPPEETLTMVLPGLFGLRHGFPDSAVNGIPVYFGRLGLRLSSEFTGVAFFILALFGLLTRGGKRTRFTLAALAICGALVSWGGYTPVFGILYKVLPVFRKLRAPHMAAFVTTSAMALSAGVGFDALFISGSKSRWKTMAGLSLLSLALILAAEPVSSALQSSWWSHNGITDTSPFFSVVSRRASILQGDFLRLFAVSGVLAIMLVFLSRGKGKAPLFAACVILVSALELIPFNRGFQVWLPNTSIESMYPDAPMLRETAGSGRVFPGGNDFIPLGIRSVTGYHAAKTVETDRLLELLSGSSPWVIRQTAMNTLATSEGAASWEQVQPLLAEDDPGFPEDPMPRAFIPRSVIQGSSDEGFQAISSGWNPEIRTLVENSPLILDGVLGTAEIVLDEPEHVTVRTETGGQGYLVLADMWYPEWKVLVDGNPENLYRANGWMRAVQVPAGEHTVEFIYGSGHIKTGGLITIAALLLAAVLVFVMGRKNA